MEAKGGGQKGTSDLIRGWGRGLLREVNKEERRKRVKGMVGHM